LLMSGQGDEETLQSASSNDRFGPNEQAARDAWLDHVTFRMSVPVA